MRSLSPEFADALRAEATTLCHCWRLARRDGAVLGFTDHDEDIAFGGLVYQAGAALDARQAEHAVGFSVGGGDVDGALSAASLTEADLDAGLYDDATVEIWSVDWSDVSRRLLLNVATIGEVRRSEYAFSAELRSLAHRLDQARGRQFQRACSADLGDARCGVALESPLYALAGTLVGFDGAVQATLTLAAACPDGFATQGQIAFAPGGKRYAVKSHDMVGGRHRIVLWSAPALAPVVGAAVTLYAGCDKSPETCREKFANIINFQGFPHMPGNDALLATPASTTQPMDGGSLFR